MNTNAYPRLRYLFDRRHVATKQSERNPKQGSVEIEIYFNGKRKFVPTGIRIYSNQWRGVAPTYIIANQFAQTLNVRLIDCMDTWQSVITEVCKDDKFSFERFERHIKLEQERSQSFIDYFKARIDERYHSEDITFNTYRSMTTLLHHIKDSGIIVEFSDLTPGNIQRFDEYLHRLGTLRQTSIYKIHKKMKAVVKECFVKKLIKENPYLGMKFRTGVAQPKRYLIEEEMNIVRSKVIVDERISKVRDLAVFQMYTGLAYADLMDFDFAQAEKRGEYYFIRDTRKKTKEVFWILLLTPAIDVLRKYDFALPKISNQKYNKYLEEVADVCGIPKFSSHDLRRTFATFALSKGTPLEIVAKTMGHTDTRQTLEYAKLLAKDVEDAMVRLDSKIK